MAIDGIPPTKIPPGAVPVVASSATPSGTATIHTVPAGRRFVLTSFVFSFLEGAGAGTHILQATTQGSTRSAVENNAGEAPVTTTRIAAVITAAATTVGQLAMSGLAIPVTGITGDTGLIQVNHGVAAASSSITIHGYEETIAG